MNLRTFIPLIIALIVLGAAGALYGAGYYFLTAQTAKAAALNSDIQQKGIELDRATRARSALSTLESDEATLNQYTVGKSDVVPFLEAIETSGKALGATVNVLSVEDEKTAGHSRISLSLSVTGSFDAVMRTLGSIEYAPYDGVIENVSLDTSTNEQKVSTGKGWNAALVYSVGVRNASTTPKTP